MAKVKTFEDLEAWQACRDLRNFVVREVSPKLPKDERFSLIQQIKDAARSTTNNIAEGYGRFHYKDNAKFCSNARGSVYEVLDHLIDANDEKLISNELLNEGRKLFERAVQVLNGYMNYLHKAANSPARIQEGQSQPYLNETAEVLPIND